MTPDIDAISSTYPKNVTRGIKGAQTIPVWPRVLANTEWRGDCLVWTGTRDQHGYGSMKIDGKRCKIHRLMALLAGHDIEGHVVMHTCDNPPCVNPEHLRVGSQLDNLRDAASKGRKWCPPLQTHCKWGHPYDEENTYWEIGRPGRRQCKECSRARVRQRRASARLA